MSLGHLSTNKASVEWRIENFFDRKDQNGCIKSPRFQLSDANFSIKIYPNGATINEVEWVSLYLCKESSPSDVRVVFNIGLKERIDGSVFICYNLNHLFSSRAQRFGCSQFMEKSHVIAAETDFGSNGTLTVFCEARVADDSTAVLESQTTLPDNIEILLRNFENIFVSGCYADVSIDVKGKKFSAHRSILSSRSTVFRSMFENDMKEKLTGSINITDCIPESFRSFLLFLYSGKLDVITRDNALDLYVIAEKYNVQELKKACCDSMVRDLCVDSVCDVVSLAALHEDQKLLKSATDYFVKNAEKILKTSKWQTLVGENLSLANELLIKMAEKLKKYI